MSVLELGSNYGNLCKILHKKVKKYTCVESNSVFNENYNKFNIEYYNELFNHKLIPKLDNNYDFIICLAILNHLKLNVNEIIDILYNLLKKMVLF
jgi:2-polyprenyl-3-methyl-5-hydroxy-6-metoxy-1,4-benzoquinol methylase